MLDQANHKMEEMKDYRWEENKEKPSLGHAGLEKKIAVGVTAGGAILGGGVGVENLPAIEQPDKTAETLEAIEAQIAKLNEELQALEKAGEQARNKMVMETVITAQTKAMHQIEKQFGTPTTVEEVNEKNAATWQAIREASEKAFESLGYVKQDAVQPQEKTKKPFYAGLERPKQDRRGLPPQRR